MKGKFIAILINSLVASVTNTVVWFSVTFWVYLQTRSVLATSVMAGIYLGTVALSGFFLGSLVDRFRKKAAMLISSAVSLFFYIVAFGIYILTPLNVLTNVSGPLLWIFIILNLMGAIAGNMRSIALSTVVTILVPEKERDKANGLVGTSNGVTFLVASIFSGLVIGFMGIFWMLILALLLTTIVLAQLLIISIPEKQIIHTSENPAGVDIRGTIKVIRAIPGLFGLIFFNTLNNFLGGVFMALMDAYGLSLVSVQFWGILWGVISTGFILGGLVITKTGLGTKPIRTLISCNLVMWTVCIFFTINPSIVLLGSGLFIYICLIPVVEATEQTIMQTLVPSERLGRVIGFAQSIEQAASPVTAFFIGPIAQFVFIPFMTTGAGVELIGDWFGSGPDRGMALLFTATGIIGLIVTLLAKSSGAYKKLMQSSVKS